MKRLFLFPHLMLGSLLQSCGGASAPEQASRPDAAPAPMEEQMAYDGAEGFGGRGIAPATVAPGAPPMAKAVADREYEPEDKKEKADSPAKGAKDQGEAPATRAWFPETFLFEPSVVTDAGGQATVTARVPDRLTTWRLLALAHSRSGGLAGAVADFLGTLAVYVDPVMPAFLVAGDTVSLPVQVVNTTGQDINTNLKVLVEGAASGAGGGTVRIPANGSAVVRIPVNARRAGSATVSATLAGADAVSRSLDIQPGGKPVEVRRGGTLAAPRTISLEAPEALLPESGRVQLVVFPGALAVLRSELGGALSRGATPADDAYALLLAGQGDDLLRALGEEPDAEALRKASILATQRALRDTRSPDPGTAALFAEAALAHPENPVIARLAERLASTLAEQQRPDGTFSADGWTLQRVLVATADAVTAVQAGASQSKVAKQRAARVSLRASAAFERYRDRITDPYTASAVLASKAVSGALQTKLRALVREAVQTGEDGSRSLPVPETARRADGTVPSTNEATALAALALADDPEASWRVDLGSRLLGAYVPGWGWGDGRSNLVCLRAVLDLFKTPIPESVAITLARDGMPVLTGQLNAQNRREVVILEAPLADAAGAHSWTVSADPPVAGLGYQVALRGQVAWPPVSPSAGASLAAQVPSGLSVGRAAELPIQAAAPAGLPLRVRAALPAGVQVDTDALDRLVSNGVISSWDTEDGAVSVVAGPLLPGQPLSLSLRVVPTLAGTLHAGPSTLALASGTELYTLPPSVWVVR